MTPNSPLTPSNLNLWHPSETTPPAWAPLNLRDRLRLGMQERRDLTLDLFDSIDPLTFCHQAHPDFSPVGWHLGHIGYTEAKWVLQHLAGLVPQLRQYDRLFAADGLPKTERQNLPGIPEILDYLAVIRTQVFDYLQQAPVEQQERLWQFLLQHESQHCETIAIVLAILEPTLPMAQLEKAQLEKAQLAQFDAPDQVPIPSGQFVMGCNQAVALDNEQPAHWVSVDGFEISRSPVTWGEYRQFMAAGGYCDRRWWSAAGWDWLQQAGVTQPFYSGWDGQPVCGVSWFEAAAYAQFVGMRLPTEMEWERAANLGAIARVGQVWEWTESWFAGYEGFAWFPYRGYSATYFDGAHRVLRGGSWATGRWTLRSSFRNWYHPWTRVIFAGIRLVRG
jgi:gamma-glutamyl hercynylcysteine S-oxide synthase